MTDYDVVIVGGGLVGLSLACALRDSGLRLAVADPGAPPAHWQPRYEDRTLALAYGSRRILEGMGVWEEIAALGASPIESIEVSERGRFGKTRLSARAQGMEALGYVAEMAALGHVLYRAFERDLAVDWLRGSVQGFVLERRAAALELSSGETGRRVRTRLVVGADGAHSAVRKAAGIDARTIDYGQTAIVANVTPERAHGNMAYERFDTTGPLALLPMRERRCTVVWSVRREQVPEMLAWDEHGFLGALQEHFGERLGEFQRAGARRHYPLALTRVDALAGPRLALAGNAAHTLHPVAGQGFNLGLRDVALLAELIADAARARCDVGDPQLLARYARTRRRDARVVSAFTDSLVRVFAHELGPLGPARSLGLVLTDLVPPLKRMLIRRTSGVAGRLPRLARGLPLGS